MEKTCSINNESLGFLSKSFKLKDGTICKECVLKSGYPLIGSDNKKSTIERLKNTTISEIKDSFININVDKTEIKKASFFNRIVGRPTFAYFIDDQKVAMFGDLGYYRYSDIESNELYVEVNQKKQKVLSELPLGLW